jgi:hypothetical protein
MGDRANIKLLIGGTLNRMEAEELANLLAEEICYDGPSSAAEFMEEMFRVTNELRSPFIFEADEVNYGNPDDIINFLKEHKMPYTLYWGQGGGYSCGMRHVSPDGITYGNYDMDNFNGEPQFSISDIEQIFGEETLTKDQRNELIVNHIKKINGEDLVFKVTND